MNGDVVFVLAVAGAALLLFVTELFPPDIVALLVLLALGLGGILDTGPLFSGFGSPVILTLVGLFMLTSALYHTGVMAYLSQLLLHLTQQADERVLVGLLSLAAGLMAMLMSAVAAVALVAPIGSYIANQRNTSPSKLLMPIAFGGVLGSGATLLSNRNLLLAEMLTERGLPTFGLLDFLPVGGPIALLGIIYLALLGPTLLGERAPLDRWGALQQARHELTRTYRLSQRLFEAEVPSSSRLVGKTVAESNLGADYGVTIAALVRGRQTFSPPDPGMRLHADDWLLLGGRPNDVASAVIDLKLAVSDPDERREEVLFANSTELAEVVLSPHSDLVGKTLGRINFREKYGLNVLAIWQNGRPYRSHLAERPLGRGDALLIQGAPEQLRILNREPDFIVLTQLPEVPENTDKATIAVVILALFLVVVAFKWLPASLAALLGAIAVVATGCETIEQARESIQWQTLFLIGGMLPLATALEQTGAADLLIDTLVRPLEPLGPHVILLAFFLVTVGLAQLTSGSAATLIVGPLAITTALHNGLNPQSFALAVAMGTATATLSPVGHPANLMVMGLGGYRFRDYAALGFPLVLIAGAGVLLLIPRLYPF